MVPKFEPTPIVYMFMSSTLLNKADCVRDMQC